MSLDPADLGALVPGVQVEEGQLLGQPGRRAGHQQRVQRLGAELQVARLADPEVLEEAHVDLVGRQAAEGVAPQVAEGRPEELEAFEQAEQRAAQHANVKNFRVFIGTIFVSIEDSQIIKFWGTSFPEAEQTNFKSARVFGSYSATAIREKLASGIWVTTLLNTVAVTDEKEKIKPFSYVVKYQNYRQGTTDVTILDDVETASK